MSTIETLANCKYLLRHTLSTVFGVHPILGSHTLFFKVT